MTTLALFGATGKVGRHLVAEALGRGLKLRALVRRVDALDPFPGLELIIGDVLDADAVGRTIAGADAVVSVIGHVAGSPDHLQRDATQNMVAAMSVHGLRRIVTLTGGGVASDGDEPKFADRMFTFFLRRAAPIVLADASAHVEVLRESGLDWTAVRAPRLTEGDARGSYRVGRVGVNASTHVRRSDLATAILDVIDDHSTIGALPFVSA